MRARAGHGVRCALRYGRVLDTALECGRVRGTALEFGRVLGTALRRFAGMGACWARRVVCVEVRARAGHGIGVVCGCGRVPGTAGGAGGLRGERTRCAYGRKIGR